MSKKKAMNDTKYIIFTDLDGTLLNHNTYAFSAAEEALGKIRQQNIPLVLVSSKTSAELEYYQKIFECDSYPCVVENGAAVFTPEGYFADMAPTRKLPRYWMYQLGKEYDKILEILERIEQKNRYTIKGFHNATKSEIAQVTNLSGAQLDRALQREFSIPLFNDAVAADILNREVNNFGLGLLYGGRFMHLLSKVDKGQAVKIIMQGFRQKYPGWKFKSVALGDSLNDLAMLNAADFPVLVKKPDGSHEPGINLPNLIYSDGIGPQGWNESILKLLTFGG